jgi:16S rRNA (cytosine1402-N4)-methyltransferase
MIPAVAPHIPVLLDEVIAELSPRSGETHVDGTYGAGGYTRAILATGADVIAFDRDPDAIALGRVDPHERLTLVEDRFSRMADHIETPVDGVTLDIGVSSMQLDQADRGFSFQSDGPLDMRMEQAGESAADFLNTADEDVIANVIYELGDEPKSRRIARGIVAARPLSRTGELASIVRRATGHKPGDKKDPATRTFQAIRIHLNRELEELEDGLAAAEQVLKPGGRLAVVTFHSLEDRLVKRFLKARSGFAPSGSRHIPEVRQAGPQPTFGKVAKPVRASAAELARNPRARSATLRVAHRTDAAPWPVNRKGSS